MIQRAIVLDANILIRAVLGVRVRQLITDHGARVSFFAAELYQGLAQQALARIAERDPDDWPALACAMMLGCPVWTEDADFFGTGFATWTTSRVLLYLAPDPPSAP
jgi:PIN domain